MDMNITLVVLIILLSIIIVICVKNIKEQNQIINKIRNVKNEELKNIFKENWDNEERRFDLKRADLLVQEKKIENKIAQLNVIFNEKENQYKAINQDLELYREGKIEEINNTVELYFKNKSDLIEQSIDEYRNLKMAEVNDQLENMRLLKNELASELKIIEADLEAERSKRAAINEEIRRARKIEEKQDFYRIQLDDEDTNDIEILRSVTARLRHPEAINKVIWTGYYQKPLAELRKRLLTNGDISGIYKITRLKTGEIYIGQTTSIDKRWQDHVKSSLGVGTLASSQLHRVMARDGPEKFTFEVLEKVEKDKLKEKEAYYIDFYDSKNYGLNSVKGQKNW